jgi:hypothetical protein
MTFFCKSVTCAVLLSCFLTACSGVDTGSYEKIVTDKARERVVSGAVYGHYADRVLSVTAPGVTIFSSVYLARTSGQYAITLYDSPGFEDLFVANLANGSQLYSVWSGGAQSTADISSVYRSEGAIEPVEIRAHPFNFSSRVNISPLTDLAYRYWVFEGKKQGGYYSYQTAVFYFFKELYGIPEQDIVHDNPSPELQSLLATVEIQLLPSGDGFRLYNRVNYGSCISYFKQFPICK